jgi:hypothetical protein
LPLPPVPPIPPPAPGVNVDPFYDPLLAFIRAGPGGSVVTLAHLKQATPAFMVAAPLAVNLQPSQLGTLFNTPQGQALYLAAQSILQPLGLWTPSAQQAWSNYVRPRASQLKTILVNLYTNLLGVPPPAPSATAIPYSPLATQVELARVWRLRLPSGKRDWLGIAAAYPDLLVGAFGHLGFRKPLVVIHSGPGGYTASVQMERDAAGGLEVHTLGEEGWRVRRGVVDSQRLAQGPGDMTLAYPLVEVGVDREVTTIDSYASDRFVALKRSGGGNDRLLDRANTRPVSTLAADLSRGPLTLRVFGAHTPAGALGGAGVGLDLGEDEDYLGLHAAASVAHEDGLGLLGYVDLEAWARTPAAKIEQDGNSARAWLKVTGAAAGLAGLPSGQSSWTLQADVRLVPELFAEVETKDLKLRLSGGVTLAVVPGGKVRLDRPERSLGLHLLRKHLEADVKIRLAEGTWLEFAAVSEFSDFAGRARWSAGVDWGPAALHVLGEISQRQGAGPISHLGLGARLHVAHLRVLSEVGGSDVRLEAGLSLLL